MCIQAAQGPTLAGASAGEGILPEMNSSALSATLRTLGVWMLRGTQRRALRELAREERLLTDVGLTVEQALRESRKPFWRP